MAKTPFQPVLPAPIPFTEAELNFTDEEPPRLFPGNQNSNWGLKRKIFSHQMQQMIDQISLLYNEMFVDTSETFLDQHEYEVGLPLNPSSKTLQQRRQLVKSRVRTGPFTDQRIRDVVESFIFATYGDAIQFTPSGVAFTSGGIPFFSGESGSLTSLYRIYQDYRNFSYEVWIKNTVGPDIAALLRELTRITPGGITVTLDTTKVNVLDYLRAIRNDQPVLHLPMGSATDASGNGNNPTTSGGITMGGATALINAAVSSSPATLYDGVDDQVAVANSALYDFTRPFTIEAWVRLDTAPVTNRTVFVKGTGSPHMLVNSSRQLYVTVGGGNSVVSAGTTLLTLGATYHVVFKKSPGKRPSLFINGVNVTTDLISPLADFVNNTTVITVGSNGASNFWSGVLDEVVLYDSYLSDAEILNHYNTGINVP